MLQFLDFQRPIFRKLAIAATIACAALIAYLSLAPADGMPEVRWSDKVNHFIAYLALSVPLAIAIGRKNWIVAIALAAGYGAMMELAQGSLTTMRTPDLFDGIANTLGACTGVAIGYMLLSLKR